VAVVGIVIVVAGSISSQCEAVISRQNLGSTSRQNEIRFLAPLLKYCSAYKNPFVGISILLSLSVNRRSVNPADLGVISNLRSACTCTMRRQKSSYLPCANNESDVVHVAYVIGYE
jgi:hypothetical protein